jgi:hypothetical protein
VLYYSLISGTNIVLNDVVTLILWSISKLENMGFPSRQPYSRVSVSGKMVLLISTRFLVYLYSLLLRIPAVLTGYYLVIISALAVSLPGFILRRPAALPVEITLEHSSFHYRMDEDLTKRVENQINMENKYG